MAASLRSFIGLRGWRKPGGSMSRKGIVSRETSASRCGCWRCVCEAWAAEQARERVHARARRKKQVVRPETLQLAGWVLLLSTLDAHTFSAEELFWLYRIRGPIELLIKQLKQFLLLVRLRSRHPDTVRTTVLAALVEWRVARRGRASAPAKFGNAARAGTAEPDASLPAAGGAVGGRGHSSRDGGEER
jgi:Transposase DDE domain